MRKALALPLIAGLASTPLLTAMPASAAEGDATVTLVHGVPGLTVDVYANGEELLADFMPGTVTDPLQVPAGTYDLTVFADGEGPNGTPALSADDVELSAGDNATVAAHLTAGGEPALNVFPNDTSAVPAGEARLTVRHAAAAPAVDVRAGNEVVFSALENGQGRSTEVPAGSLSAAVALAGTDTAVIGPADLDLGEGTSTVVYAWGNEDAGYQLATQSVDVSHSAPGGVDAGEAGLAGDALPSWALGLMGVAALGAAGSAVALRRRPVSARR